MRKESGFTLIELLIVVAIIGIIAAIAVPNLMDAVERARQKRSVADIRGMVIAMQTFRTDYAGYPPSACNGPVDPNLSGLTDANGQTVIVPDLIQAMPKFDGWRGSFQYFAGPDGTSINQELQTPVAKHFIIFSLGSDGAPSGGSDGAASAPVIGAAWCSDPQPLAMPGVRESHCYQSDIVWGDSSFEQSPDGKQTKC